MPYEQLKVHCINWGLIYSNHSFLICWMYTRISASYSGMVPFSCGEIHAESLCQEPQRIREPHKLICNYIKTATNNYWTDRLLHHSNQKFSGNVPSQSLSHSGAKLCCRVLFFEKRQCYSPLPRSLPPCQTPPHPHTQKHGEISSKLRCAAY